MNESISVIIISYNCKLYVEDCIKSIIFTCYENIPEIIVVDNNGTSDIYVAAGDAVYSASNATTSIGGETYGIYKSSDEGANWSQIDMPLTADVNGHKFEPNDLDYDAAGTIWVATNNSTLYGDGGGTILSSTPRDTMVA